MTRVRKSSEKGRFGSKRAGKRTAKRAGPRLVQKKGAATRRLLEKGFWIFDMGQTPSIAAEQSVERVPRGHRKVRRPARAARLLRIPSGRGVSEDMIFVTGKKPTGPDQLSGGRAKPRKESPSKRRPRRTHRSHGMRKGRMER